MLIIVSKAHATPRSVKTKWAIVILHVKPKIIPSSGLHALVENILASAAVIMKVKEWKAS